MDITNLPEEEILVTPENIESLVASFNNILNPFGFEAYPFLIGWYNEFVSARLKLANEGNPSLVSLCIISNPKMFEASFLNHVMGWLKQVDCLNTAFSGIDWPQEFTPRDPLDRSVYLRLSTAFQTLIASLKGTRMEAAFKEAIFLPDYALRPVNRLCVVHMSTAGHVAGAAYFHSPNEAEKESQVVSSEEGIDSPVKLVGCSLHPYHGGWFGYRGIFMLPRLICPELERCEAKSSLSRPFKPDVIRDLLTQYTCYWRNQVWRDFGLTNVSQKQQEEKEEAEEARAPRRYSLAARLYFNTECKQRLEMLQIWAREGVPTFNLVNSQPV